jgi:hypothetical protein
MGTIDRLLPAPRSVELDFVDLAAPPGPVWERLRHGALPLSPLARALFAIRTLPDRLADRAPPAPLVRLDDLRSTPEAPGFRILAEGEREVAVGAIGKVWMPDIPFVHVADPEAFHAFAEPDYLKVAWALRALPHGEGGSRVEFELRTEATDEAAWEKFRRYFLLIGPGSHLIRRSALRALVREFGGPGAHEDDRPLEGDELLPDAAAQITHSIAIAARPEQVWPWLVQMGCRRGGFYSVDALDNGGERSARELHPDLQRLAVGDVIAATPEGRDGFEVLALRAPRALVLGGLHDVAGGRQLAFDAARPERYWHVTWSFVLEPLDGNCTRLHARARAAWSPSEGLHATWIRPVHHFMQEAQLRELAARAEGRLARDDWRDVLEGAGGVAWMLGALVTPFLRGARNHWGLDEGEAARARPGDEVIPEPRWSWTHGVEIDAPASEVWPWVAQIGADRGGFYSYQALENAVGCGVRNAETVHPEMAHREGDTLVLHPKMPPLRVASVAEGRHLLAVGAPGADAVATGERWTAATWLFQVEPLGPRRCRLVSRYRCACSDDLATRLSFGPTLLEPVGFAMDRRMLLGVKARVERAAETSALR